MSNPLLGWNPLSLDVVTPRLFGRAERRLVGSDGIRRIGAPLESNGGSPLIDWLGNYLPPSVTGVLKQVLSFGGWLISGVQSLFRFSAAGVWGGAVQTAAFLWHFNWNASGEQLDAAMAGLRNQIAGHFGMTLGNAAGYYVCGVLPASKMVRFNEAMAARILEEVNEEAFDEFAQNLAQTCRLAWNLAAQAMVTTAFKNTRNVIKGIFENPNSPQSQALESIFGDSAQDAIAAWGTGNQSWTFAEAVEEKIESIPNQAIRNFTEEFLEEFFDACVEAGYIVANANGIDAWYTQQRLQRDIVLGSEEGVEIRPNRETDERMVLVGREQVLRPVITQAMSTAIIMENRDIGQFVGEPVREYVKSAPAKLVVKLVWSRFEYPPLFREGVYKPPTLEVKGFDRTKLDFALIKQLMGGENGRDWGRFYASCSLVDPQGIIVARPRLYAGSETEAENLLTTLLTTLSDFEIATMTTGEEKKFGRKASGRAMAKETRRVYPAYMTIFNAEKVINEDEGRAQIAGSYKRKNDRLPLWVSTKPDNWEETIADLLAAPGADSPTP